MQTKQQARNLNLPNRSKPAPGARADTWTVGLSAVLLFLSSAISHSADWREETGTFRVSMPVSGNSSERLARLEPFRLSIQEKLGLPVEIRPDGRLSRLIANQAERPFEYLVLPASAYAAIWNKCECIEPLVVATTAAGDSAVRGVLIVRQGSNAETPGDLSGSPVFALSRSSVAGYGLQQEALEKAGVTGVEWRFAENAELALSQFASGEGNAIAGWIPANGDPATATVGTLARLKELTAEGQDDFRIIWTSGPVPNRVHAVRKNLHGEAKRLLREHLVGLEKNDPIVYDALEPDFAGGFAVARQGDFATVIEFLAEDEPVSTPDQPEDAAADDQPGQDSGQTQQ